MVRPRLDERTRMELLAAIEEGGTAFILMTIMFVGIFAILAFIISR